jgi:hypothetical protein
METLLVYLTAALIAVLVVPLAVLRAGIWQQDHAARSGRRPRGLCAAIAHRAIGPYTNVPDRPVSPAASPRCPNGGRPAAGHVRRAG